MTHEDRALDYLEHVLVACNRTMRHIHGADEARFLQDYTIHDAAIHAITVAGEAANRIRRKAPEFMHRHGLTGFVELIAMRNELIHGYDKTDLQVAWLTASRDIPVLREKLLSVLHTLGKHTDPNVLHFQ